MYGNPERNYFDASAQVPITHPTYRPPNPNQQANFYMERPSTTRLDPPPWVGETSLSASPWQQPYLWEEDLDPNAPDAKPRVLHPPPEGVQSTSECSDTFPPYCRPQMPVTYGPSNRSDPSDWRQDQASPYQTASYYPVHRPWDNMTPYEKQTFVEESQRDSFIRKLYQDVGDLRSELQYQHVPNFNRLEDRDRYMEYMFGAAWDNPRGNYSLRPNFRDKWSTLYLKYHVHP